MKGRSLLLFSIFILCLGIHLPLEAAGDSQYSRQEIIIVIEQVGVADQQRSYKDAVRRRDYRDHSPWYYENIDEYGYRDRRCRLRNRYEGRRDYRNGHPPWYYENIDGYSYRSGYCGRRW